MLKKISVKNYRSLKEVEIPLRRFNVFVGPNNSGKSNILDSLELLADLINGSWEKINERGEFRSVVWGGNLGQHISINIEAALENSTLYQYEVGLSGTVLGSCHINSEKLFIYRKKGRKKIISRAEGKAKILDVKEKDHKDYTLESTVLAVNRYTDKERNPHNLALKEFIQGWSFYNISPPHMRNPMQVRKESRLLKGGENLSAVLHTLQSQYRGQFDSLEKELKRAIPEVEEVMTQLTTDGRTFVSIRESSFEDDFPVMSLSDGVLRFLGYLSVIYSTPPPTLICFEEPENCVHPKLLQLLVDLMKEASARTQMLITTHSPFLVNWLDPEDLVIVDKQDGQTKCKKAPSKRSLKEILKDIDLGDLWVSGGLK
jgi:predicted ATPase